PIRIDEYMRACASDSEHGYWGKADTIGSAGDFITAPEVSQIFGELIGLWCVAVWQSLGQPPVLRLVELGPGRATLMRDALRAAGLVPAFLDAAHVHLVEVSPTLRAAQCETLGGGNRSTLSPSPQGEGESSARFVWHESVDQVPEGPAIMI